MGLETLVGFFLSVKNKCLDSLLLEELLRFGDHHRKLAVEGKCFDTPMVSMCNLKIYILYKNPSFRGVFNLISQLDLNAFVVKLQQFFDE